MVCPQERGAFLEIPWTLLRIKEFPSRVSASQGPGKCTSFCSVPGTDRRLHSPLAQSEDRIDGAAKNAFFLSDSNSEVLVPLCPYFVSPFALRDQGCNPHLREKAV